MKSRLTDVPELVREVLDADAPLLDALAGLGPSGKAPPQLLRERLLATVQRPRLRYAPLFGALSELFDLPDADLAALFERAASAEAWLPTAIVGTELLHLQGGPRVSGADNGLVRIAPGMGFPSHRHGGLERALLLDGSYRDEPSGRVYVAGDLHEMHDGSTHAYVVAGDRPLLLAVSVVGGIEVEGFGTLSPSSR